jgi:hypothetical protein
MLSFPKLLEMAPVGRPMTSICHHRLTRGSIIVKDIFIAQIKAIGTHRIAKATCAQLKQRTIRQLDT